MTRPMQGFVLPLTLWIIALAGLAVAAINSWVTVATENAQALQAQVDTELVMSNVKNELVYTFGTRTTSFRGLEVGDNEAVPQQENDMLALLSNPPESSEYLRLDGQPYVLDSNPDYVIQVQDARGLINLNSVPQQSLQRFLSLFNVSEVLQNQLPDTLQDWIDEDDLTRLAGAEKTEYARLSRHPPSNQNTVTPMEAQSIFGWDKIPTVWQADLQSPLFTTCAITGFNPNTAPEASLLSYIAGMTPDNAAAVMAQRKKTPFRSSHEFMGTAGVVLPNEAFFLSFIPGGCMTVEITHRTTNEKIRFSLTLLRVLQGQPWQVDYVVHIPSQYRRPVDGVDPKITFPTPEALYTKQQGNNPNFRLQ